MTSSSGRRSNSASPIRPDDDDVAALKKRKLRLAQILDGALPTTDEMLSGFPPRNDDLQSDVMAFIDDWRQRRPEQVLLQTDLFVAAETTRVTADHVTLTALRTAAAASGDRCREDHQLAQRADLWLALIGDLDAAGRVILRGIRPERWGRQDVGALYRVAFSIGLSSMSGDGEYESGDVKKVVWHGLRSLSRIEPLIAEVTEADFAETGLESLLKRQRAAQSQDDEDRAVGALEALIESGAFEDDDDSPLSGEGIIVVPAMTEGVGGQKETRKSWKGLAGVPLPVVARGDVAAHKRALTSLYPHAEDIVDIMLRDLAPRDGARFRPTLLVGSPGSGKSSLLRAIADQIGLPCELNSVAGSTDSSAMGTSAQWSTVRESVPLQLIKRSRHASVCIIWDEVDKASSSRNNGSVIDALLPLLELDQARRHRDLALEVEVDLSAVSHFATANSLESVPAPLRDRLRLLTMPEPTWAHLGTLTRQIVDPIASERGVHPGFFEPLGQDEMDNVRKNWPGGSMRQLTQILTTIIDRRDAIMARC